MRRYLVYTVGLLLVLSYSVAAQESGTRNTPVDTVGSLPGIEIGTSVNPAEAYIGDLITYTLTITYDSTLSLVPPPLGANLGAFDVKDYTPDQETVLDDGRIQSVTEFKLSTFTTGDYMIPPLPIVFDLPDGGKKAILTEPAPMKILSILGDSTDIDTVEIMPLKEPYEYPVSYAQYYYWGGGALGVILLLLLAWWLRRRLRKDKVFVDRRPPWEIAYEKLAFLKQGSLVTERKFVEHYFQLTEITREYLSRMYQVGVSEMTTGEFAALFENTQLPQGIYEEALEFYRYADLVKFAKFEPELEKVEQDFSTAHRIVDKVREDYERRYNADPSNKQKPHVWEEQPEPEEAR